MLSGSDFLKMSAISNLRVMKCEARCEGRCVCSEPTVLIMTSVQGTQGSLAAGIPGESVDSVSHMTTATNGATSVLRNRYKRLEEEDTRCLCHEKPKPTDRKARNKLIAACVIVFFFMIGEIVGKMTLQVE